MRLSNQVSKDSVAVFMREIGKVADGLEAEKTETWYQLVSAYNRLYRLEFHGRLLYSNL